MSTVKSNNVQIGQSVTATNNFVLYQPSTPDGTVRLGNGNAGSVTDLVTVNSSGNVGIGTSSPVSLLHVNSASASAIATVQSTTYAVFRSKNSSRSVDYASDGTGGYIDIGAAPFRWYNGASEYMRLDSSGNLGLGVTPSAWGSGQKYIQSNNAAIGSGGLGSGFFRVNNYYDGTVDRYVGSSNAGVFGFSGGAFAWYNAPSGTAGNAISFTQAMTLDASGNLLVGTTTSNSGSNGLKVAGPTAITGSSGFTGNYTIGASDTFLTAYSLTATCTVTLPTPSTNTGRMLFIRTQSNFAVNSASSNVTTLSGGGVTTSILTATAGKWAILWCDGSYWNIFAAN